jgi:hypothetical protein
VKGRPGKITTRCSNIANFFEGIIEEILKNSTKEGVEIGISA